MKVLARILLATEFSPACEQARAHAAALARRSGAQLHILHVQVLHGDQYGWAGIPNVADVESALEDAANQRLNDFIAPLPDSIVHAVQRDVSAAPTVLRYAQEHQIDLIILGSHGRRGLRRFFMGSVASEIVRGAEIPVLVIGPEHRAEIDSYDCVMAPVDFSASSVAAMREAAEIAHLHKARLVVAHCIDTRPMPPYYAAEFAEAERDRARADLDELIRDADLEVTAEPVIKVGIPHAEIIQAAKEHNADLIVMGSSGLSSLDRLLIGSTTERVLRAAPCPLLAHRGGDTLRI